MFLILLLLFLFKVIRNEQHHVQATRNILLIGNVRSASTPTLLHARYAIDALSPGLKTALLSDETLLIQVQVQSSFLIRSIPADFPMVHRLGD